MMLDYDDYVKTQKILIESIFHPKGVTEDNIEHFGFLEKDEKIEFYLFFDNMKSIIVDYEKLKGVLIDPNILRFYSKKEYMMIPWRKR